MKISEKSLRKILTNSDKQFPRSYISKKLTRYLLQLICCVKDEEIFESGVIKASESEAKRKLGLLPCSVVMPKVDFL